MTKWSSGHLFKLGRNLSILIALLSILSLIQGEGQKNTPTALSKNAPCTEDEGPKKCPPKPTFAGQYPFVGSLDIESSDNFTNLCVVTAVSEEWVITVHSCLKDLVDVSDVKATVDKLNQAGVRIRIPNHSLNEDDIGENVLTITDLASSEPVGEERLLLLRISEPLSTELADKVNIGSRKDVDEEEDRCLIVGWTPVDYTAGKDVRQINTTKLKDIGQNLVKNKACQDATQLSNVVCGRSLQEEDPKTICKFEWGSPLLCQSGSSWRLVGVTGALMKDESVECSPDKKLSVYIHIEPFIHWMYSQIRYDEGQVDQS